MLNKLAFGILSLLFMTSCAPSESWLISSTVKLISKEFICSGTKIETPSGKRYILSAAHCLPLAENGVIKVQTEDGGTYLSKVIAEDEHSDLLLLESVPSIPAVKIAKEVGRFEELRSFTHGAGYPTYKTSGQYVGEKLISFILFEIKSEQDKKRCNLPKNKIEEIDVFGLFTAQVCLVNAVGTVTTVPAVPGSSGGLIVNAKGELVGVVSAGNNDFTYIVKLSDIHRFLENR